MKLILSRKGFDSAAGGVASPIFPDGVLISLPIRARGAQHAFREIAKGPDGSLGPLVEDLTRGRCPGDALAHLDPDLAAEALHRAPSWRPAFGQTGAAATHLARSGVGPGDVFVFFGWFRAVERGADGRWRYRNGAPDLHSVFGWLQIGEAIRVDERGRDALLAEKPWLAGHPHLHFGPDPRNILYLAADRLTLPGLDDSGLPGGGEIARFDERLAFSCRKAGRRSIWRLPDWFLPGEDRPPLTYHSDPKRWSRDGGDALLASAAQGQEFVLDCAGRPEAAPWLLRLLGAVDTPRSGRR